ncbi:MAG: hypothetical protein LBE91_16835 [Tannerella sp.]|jgi:uncharacterized integral membrane protein|nr:hypothetical protein [Tannerella sp.]
MKQLINTKLILLIKESTSRTVSVLEWEQSYEAFAGIIFGVSAETTGIVYHNALCYVRAELAFWQSNSILKKKSGILNIY